MRKIQSSLLYRWFDQVWNQNDENAIDRLMANDAEFHGIVTENNTKGVPGFKLFFRDFTSRFHNITIDVEDVVSEDDMESARTLITATHTASNKVVVVPGICMIKVESGKIAEAWNHYDFLSLHEQLGQKLVPVE
ncbi:ester cyclase [Dyadobacter sp. LHD-138]|uniref:ester cyclase n=1 Tax=Dyadobacter sp. LHD-138 TaxID=3071413 RepID=UPI0027E10C37|nr:ester cyclase [Dyadobacter sp. LHD-138]MDQ6478065.1 ester cyclase [Dyadobacter sp. LHD-138]